MENHDIMIYNIYFFFPHCARQFVKSLKFELHLWRKVILLRIFPRCTRQFFVDEFETRTRQRERISETTYKGAMCQKIAVLKQRSSVCRGSYFIVFVYAKNVLNLKKDFKIIQNNCIFAFKGFSAQRAQVC